MIAVMQVSTFGMGLVTLDVRQESSKHAGAMDAITTFLGLGSYMEWDEKKRREFLIAELNSKRPLMPAGAQPPPHILVVRGHPLQGAAAELAGVLCRIPPPSCAAPCAAAGRISLCRGFQL